MQIFKYLKWIYLRVRYFSHGGISFRELARYLLLYRWRKVKRLESIRCGIRDKKWLQKKPTELSDLKKVFSFRYMNRTEREITKSLCEAIDARMLRQDYQPLVDRTWAKFETGAERLSIMWLLDAEILALAGGLLIISGNIRRMFVGRMLKKYERKRNVQCFDVQRLYAIYLGRGEKEKALEVLERAGNAWRQYDVAVYNAMRIAATKGADYSHSLLKPKTKADRIFYEMIHGKSVALLGPAAGPLDVDEVTREFDVKIRITYRGMDFLGEEAKRCGVDVSYYNRFSGGFLGKQKNTGFFNDLKMAVFKDINHDYQIDMAKDGRARSALGNPNLFMHCGDSNMVQRVVMDLFYFAPARIKLFNVNLYLSDEGKRYQSGYFIKEQIQSREIMWGSFSGHNMTSNYELTKLWYEAGYFEADEMLDAVLSLGTDEYLRRMESLTQ